MVPTLCIAFLVLSTLLAVVKPVTADTYDMVKEYAGPTFFDEWTFYDHLSRAVSLHISNVTLSTSSLAISEVDNLTNGNVIGIMAYNARYLSASDAFKSKLAFVDSTTNHAIIKVDNTSNVEFNKNRNSVRMQTDVGYSVGSVWTIDMLHVPFGCSVWPAWWSTAETREGGEIDTFEGVNLASHSIMGLHTTPGCTQVGQNQSSSIVNSTDCSFLANNNQGCITTVPSTQSYGAAFAQAGGGFFVTEFAESGISIWFFPRADVPGVLSSNSSTIDTSSLGQPVGNWPSTQCNSSQFFQPQNLIFTVTLCGGELGVIFGPIRSIFAAALSMSVNSAYLKSFPSSNKLLIIVHSLEPFSFPSIDLAGRVDVFSQTCTGVCYNDFVLGNGSNYADAYFEVSSVRVFSKQGTNTVVGVPKSSGAGLTVEPFGRGVLLRTAISVGLAGVVSWTML
ncbi:LOW QUALITY PROTEIN: hypothetical protein CVT25_002824 [Psilocybe cyanescens]|uniref:GH16 domain-containing protein n=1 Tax=Psilocybe cyanescens TaxID=93625 RepID=A0A409WL18_PSICY|nr:LOW QUALITY PROTEIN: hypothetical protein CVT25_002824 [Psilocybe cyanescens]